MAHASAWIEGGHDDIPRARGASSLELAVAGRKEGALLFERIRAGTYDTIVVRTPLPDALARAHLASPSSVFYDGLARAIAERYRLEEGAGVPPTLGVFRLAR